MEIILDLNLNYILISYRLYFKIKELLNSIFDNKLKTANFYINFFADVCELLGYIIFLEIVD